VARCSVLYYNRSHSFGHSEARCRCAHHGVDFFPSGQPTQLCPVGLLEDSLLVLISTLELKVTDLEARIDQHEQDYYNAQHPQNVRAG
jgi:hypothetical protein